MRSVRIEVLGRLDTASRPQRGTLTIDRGARLVSVRPLRRHRTYELPIDFVAEWICRHVILQEMKERRRQRAEERKARRERKDRR